MTNKDYFLKEGVSVEELAEEIAKAIEDRMLMYSSDKNTRISRDSVAIYEFFIDTAKPTLTEDERVILRNIDIKAFEKIGRDKTGHLYLWWEDNRYLFRGYNHLFQFIKERRRVFNRRTIARYLKRKIFYERRK